MAWGDATVSLLRAFNPFTNREMEPTPDDVADDLLSLSFTSTATTTSDATLTATSSFSFSSASSPRLLSLSDLKFLLRLGSGDIGSVYLAELSSPPLPTSPSDPHQHHEAPSPAMFAAKVMDKKELASRNKEGRARTEMEILEMLQHPFLPSLYAAVDSQKWLCLLTEFCPGGDLHVLRQRQPLKRFEESAVRFYASEVVVALEYLHMMGIVYRDLKPENVLVRTDGHIMLTDFDLSLKCDTSTSTAQIVSDTIQPIPAFPNGHINPGDQPPPFSACILPNCIVPVVSCFHPKRHRRKRPARRHAGLEFVAKPVDVRSMSFVGTHEYLAPEIVSGEGHGSAVDWWTLGIFIFELFHGVTPFRGLDNEMTLTNIVARALEFPKEPNVPAAAKDLISQLLVKDPDWRLGSIMGASALRHHPFFNGVNWALLRCTTPPFVPQPFSKDLLSDESCLETPVDYY